MNFTQIQARATLLASFGGWSDVSPAPAWDILSNEAWQEFGWISELYIGKEAIAAVGGQVQYPLVNTYKAVTDVDYQTQPMLRSTEVYERSLNPNWLNTPGGTPIRWALAQFSVLSIIPPPSTSTGNFNVRGVIQPPAMATGTDLPGQVNGVGIPIPTYFHEAIALRAAILQGEVYESAESSLRIASYMTQYYNYINDARTGLTIGYRRRAPEPRPNPFSGQQQGG